MGVDVGVSEEVLLNTELFGGFTIRLVPYKSRQDLSVQGTHTQLVKTVYRGMLVISSEMLTQSWGNPAGCDESAQWSSNFHPVSEKHAVSEWTSEILDSV